MAQIKTLLPRGSGQEWNITKIHELLHIIEDMLRNGAMKNGHTGPQEHAHITTVKNPAETVQKRRPVFDNQTAN